MKIEKDKFFKTRDGRKVRIYSTEGNVDDNIHGAIEKSDGWMSRVWDKDLEPVWGGAAHTIVGEWVEPKEKVTKYLWANKRGEVRFARIDKNTYALELSETGNEGEVRLDFSATEFEVEE